MQLLLGFRGTIGIGVLPHGISALVAGVGIGGSVFGLGGPTQHSGLPRKTTGSVDLHPEFPAPITTSAV